MTKVKTYQYGTEGIRSSWDTLIMPGNVATFFGSVPVYIRATAANLRSWEFLSMYVVTGVYVTLAVFRARLMT